MNLGRTNRRGVLGASLALIATGFTVSVTGQPAFAATCSLASGLDVHTLQWYRNQADASTSVNIQTGPTISGDQFHNELYGQRAFSNEYAPTVAWFRPLGEKSYPVNFQNNGCKGVAVFIFHSSSFTWMRVCIAESPGQIHAKCDFDTPEGLVGYLWTGESNPSNGNIGTNPSGTYIVSS